MGISNIVFAGGGSKGIVYLGILKGLQELQELQELDISNFYGTSIGALFSLCCTLQIKYEILYNFLISEYQNLKPCTSIQNLLSFYGTDTGVRLLRLIHTILDIGGVHKEITFSELHLKTEKGLFVISSDLKDQCIKRFNHVDTPHVQVDTAILSSMSLPIIFKPVLGRYIDGALLCNFPILEAPDTPETLGFHFGGKRNTSENLVNYISNLFSCITAAQVPNAQSRRVIKIPIDIKSLTFDLSQEQISSLVNVGYNIISSTLNKGPLPKD